MSKKLYRVQIETEIMVIANSNSEAIEIAKKNAPAEIPVYGKGSAFPVRDISEVPEDWKSVIPYSNESNETRKCFEIASTMTKQESPKEDIDVLLKVKGESKQPTVNSSEVTPETRPDPKPKELDWHDVKSGRPMKQLRFVR